MDQIKKIILSLNLLKDVERNRSFKGLEKYNVIFITIVTPIQNNRNINLKNLLNLINQLKNKIESNTILVLKSTVKSEFKVR